MHMEYNRWNSNARGISICIYVHLTPQTARDRRTIEKFMRKTVVSLSLSLSDTLYFVIGQRKRRFIYRSFYY